MFAFFSNTAAILDNDYRKSSSEKQSSESCLTNWTTQQTVCSVVNQQHSGFSQWVGGCGGGGYCAGGGLGLVPMSGQRPRGGGPLNGSHVNVAHMMYQQYLFIWGFCSLPKH